MSKKIKQQRVNTKEKDFLPKTKTDLAHRAGFRCSFTGCEKGTSCSSQESSRSYTNIGEAAHICARSPGGRRYNPGMTDIQCSDISNGIWLCRNHHKAIDSDEITYTAEVLHAMKRAHEEKIAREVMSIKLASNMDLIAIGFDIIFVGEIVGTNRNEWKLRIVQLVFGTIETLINFIDDFNAVDISERFVLVNELGDGRQLASPPAWERCTFNSDSYIVRLCVQEKVRRVHIDDFGTTLATNEENDLFMVNGNLSVVSGLQAFEETLKQILSTMRGEVLFNPSVGTNIIDFFNISLYRGSGWLAHLVKLELIRLACISGSKDIAPLRSVLKVNSINQLHNNQKKDWVRFHIELDLKGKKPWKGDVDIFIPTDYEEYLQRTEIIKKRTSSFIKDTR